LRRCDVDQFSSPTFHAARPRRRLARCGNRQAKSLVPHRHRQSLPLLLLRRRDAVAVGCVKALRRHTTLDPQRTAGVHHFISCIQQGVSAPSLDTPYRCHARLIASPSCLPPACLQQCLRKSKPTSPHPPAPPRERPPPQPAPAL